MLHQHICLKTWKFYNRRYLSKAVSLLGQYDGKGKPLPEYHVRISGFDERVCCVCHPCLCDI